MRRIQVAFQGGGARVLHLLAAVDALQGFEEHVQITRVAGTSAGSIAATVLAANVDAADFAKAFIDKSQDTLKALRNCDPVHSTILDTIPVPTKRFVPRFAVQFVWDYAKNQAKEIMERDYADLLRILEGQPLFYSRIIHSEIRRLIGLCQRGQDRDNKELIIMATNLLDAKAEPFHFTSFSGQESKVYDAIVNSCAIPFAFRTPKDLNITNLVGGGLCENLPCDILHEMTANRLREYGEIVAIGFEEEKRLDMATDVKSYLGLLFEASINNSMLRAKAKLKPEAIHEIRPRLTTLGFDEMAQHGPGSDSWERIKYETELWLDSYLHGYANNDAVMYHIPARRQPLAAEITEKITKIAEAQWDVAGFDIERYNLIVQGFSLEAAVRMHSPADTLRRRDRMITEAEYRLKTEHLYCIRLAFEGGEGDPPAGQAPVHVKVLEMDGTEIPVVVMAGGYSRIEQGVFAWRQVGWVFFTPPLTRGPSEEKRFKVRTEQKRYALDQAPQGWDVMAVSATLSAINSVDIVVFLPPGVGAWEPSCLSKFDNDVGVDGKIMGRAQITAEYEPYNEAGWSGYGLTTGRLELNQAAILKISKVANARAPVSAQHQPESR